MQAVAKTGLNAGRVANVILAAGSSTRMGQPKQLLTFGGKTLLRRAVELGAAVGCRKMVVVLAGEEPRMLTEIRETFATVEPVVNEHWQRGVGTSIKKGASAVFGPDVVDAPAIDAVLFTTCDMPLVDVAFIKQLMMQCSANDPLAASGYPDGPGIPAIFGRAFHGDLLRTPDAHGCQAILQANRARCPMVPLGEKARDIDTIDDYQKLVERGQQG